MEHKRLVTITEEDVKVAFGGNNLKVFNDSDSLFNTLKCIDWKGKNLLIMSSGNFSGKNIKEFGKSIIQ
jgi:UDP-N-acetylmuramate: L-alanyl-gamma-D-glutamyl-meso-diaminopimelate ligase